MRKEDINILKLKKKNNFIQKNEIKGAVLKSMVNNRNLAKVYRNFAAYKLGKGAGFKKFHHICLKNNKASSINNKFYLSKYALKNAVTLNKAQNISLSS